MLKLKAVNCGRKVNFLQLHSHLLCSIFSPWNLTFCTLVEASFLRRGPCWPFASVVSVSQSKQANCSHFIQSWSSSTCTPPYILLYCWCSFFFSIYTVCSWVFRSAGTICSFKIQTSVYMLSFPTMNNLHIIINFHSVGFSERTATNSGSLHFPFVFWVLSLFFWLKDLQQMLCGPLK